MWKIEFMYLFMFLPDSHPLIFQDLYRPSLFSLHFHLSFLFFLKVHRSPKVAQTSHDPQSYHRNNG